MSTSLDRLVARYKKALIDVLVQHPDPETELGRVMDEIDAELGLSQTKQPPSELGFSDQELDGLEFSEAELSELERAMNEIKSELGFAPGCGHTKRLLH